MLEPAPWGLGMPSKALRAFEAAMLRAAFKLVKSATAALAWDAAELFDAGALLLFGAGGFGAQRAGGLRSCS